MRVQDARVCARGGHRPLHGSWLLKSLLKVLLKERLPFEEELLSQPCHGFTRQVLQEAHCASQYLDHILLRQAARCPFQVHLQIFQPLPLPAFRDSMKACALASEPHQNFAVSAGRRCTQNSTCSQTMVDMAT